MYQSFYSAAVGAGSCTKKLSVIGNNLANINTNSFKPQTAVFSDLINYNLNDSEGAVTELQSGDGARVERTYTTFDVSAVTQTGSQYDYAIMQPNAFFMVQNPETGAISYTRNGHFHCAEMEDGFYLATDAGKLVLDQNGEPLKADVTDVEKLLASTQEDYEEEDEDDDDEEDDENTPRVSVYTFNNPSRLLSLGKQEYVPSDAGVEATLIEHPSLVQGALEASGADMAREMARLIECQKAFSFALRMVTTSDEIEGTINSLRG